MPESHDTVAAPAGDSPGEHSGGDLSTHRSSSDVADRLPPPAPAQAPALKLDTLTARLARGTTAPESVPPPTLLGYEILEELGRGGMGIVYKARDIRLNRLVALKMILGGDQATPDELARFRREAEAVARVQHPNVIQIHEVGEYQGRPYFALEFAGGGSLADRVNREPLAPAQAARFAEVLARALHAVHQQGVIHRDLKPANVLITSDGVPKLGDFGLAKQLDKETAGATRRGTILGTPSYMAPEQARGDISNIGPVTDVYALGVLLYELLTGRPPFRADSVLETLEMVCTREPVSPRALQPRVPRDLETICVKCLHKEPRRRYDSALSLADDLCRFLDGRPIRARPVGVTERGLKWARRHPAVAALIPVSFLGALALVGVLVSLGYGHRLAATNAELQAAFEKANAAQAEAERQREAAVRQQGRAEDLEARMRYIQHITLAHREWQAGHVGRAVELLDGPGCPARLRGWEWHYLQRLCHTDLLTLRGHSIVVQSVAFDPSGQRLASGALDGTINVWDLATGLPPLTFRVPIGFLECLAFSPDGKRLAGAGGIPPNPVRPGEVKVWDAATGKELLSFRGHTAEALSVTFSPDGKRLASAGADRTIKVWDANTGKELFSLQGHTDSIKCVAFSPDGERLASASRDGTVRVWDACDPPGARPERLCLRGHQQVVFRVAFSPDGQHLASCGNDQTARVWDLARGQSVTLTGHSASVNGVAYSPDGRLLATVSHDRMLKLWEAASGQEVLSLKGHADYIACVAFSPDGKRVATGSGDRTVKVWETTAYQGAHILSRPPGVVNSVAVSRDGKCLASTSTGGYDKQGRPLPGLVEVWDAVTGRQTLSLEGHTAEVSSVAFSPNGKRLASAGGGFVSRHGVIDRWSEVKVWDAATGEPILSLEGHSDRATAVIFSPDGERLATASWDRTVKVWNAHTGEEERTFRGHTDTVWSVAFSPDGQHLASSGRDQTVRVWDLTTGQEAFTCHRHTASVNSVAFSLDGQWLASASFDQTVKVWNAHNGEEIATLVGHTSGALSVAFSPDGRRLASAALGGSVKVWDRVTGQEVLSLENACRCLVFSPDGGQLTGAGPDGTLTVWDARPLPPR